MTTTTGIKTILIYFAHLPLPKNSKAEGDQCVSVSLQMWSVGKERKGTTKLDKSDISDKDL